MTLRNEATHTHIHTTVLIHVYICAHKSSCARACVQWVVVSDHWSHLFLGGKRGSSGGAGFKGGGTSAKGGVWRTGDLGMATVAEGANSSQRCCQGAASTVAKVLGLQRRGLSRHGADLWGEASVFQE